MSMRVTRLRNPHFVKAGLNSIFPGFIATTNNVRASEHMSTAPKLAKRCLRDARSTCVASMHVVVLAMHFL